MVVWLTLGAMKERRGWVKVWLGRRAAEIEKLRGQTTRPDRGGAVHERLLMSA